MSTRNICFHGEISVICGYKKPALSGSVYIKSTERMITFHYLSSFVFSPEASELSEMALHFLIYFTGCTV